jgi:ABC-type lipoprotein export system ATPase subunit
VNAVEVIEVSKEYPDAEGAAPRRVLDGISFTLGTGESMGVVGPSGCGKSTLLNLIGLLDEPTSGEIRLGGRSVIGLKETERTSLRARHLGFIFQLHHLLPQCTVLENVLVPSLALRPSRVEAAAARTRALALLERVGLADQAAKFPTFLSGGERQRVAVIRALINQPQLVLADEPTGALDRKNAEVVQELLLGLCRDTTTALIVVSHDAQVAQRLGRVFTLP